MSSVNPYTSHFSYSNNTVAQDGLNRIELGLKTNYAVTQLDDDVVQLSNKTAGLDTEEIITLRYKEIPKVNTPVTVTNPAAVKKAISYTVAIDELLRVHNETLNTDIDRPVSAYINIRHEKASDITEDVICEVITRLISVFWNDSGEFRAPDFMRSALLPDED